MSLDGLLLDGLFFRKELREFSGAREGTMAISPINKASVSESVCGKVKLLVKEKAKDIIIHDIRRSISAAKKYNFLKHIDSCTSLDGCVLFSALSISLFGYDNQRKREDIANALGEEFQVGNTVVIRIKEEYRKYFKDNIICWENNEEDLKHYDGFIKAGESGYIGWWK